MAEAVRNMLKINRKNHCRRNAFHSLLTIRHRRIYRVPKSQKAALIQNKTEGISCFIMKNTKSQINNAINMQNRKFFPGIFAYLRDFFRYVSIYPISGLNNFRKYRNMSGPNNSGVSYTFQVIINKMTA
jgi:hypothetical protein